MWITRASINQPVFATMVMLALVVLGVFSYRLLPVEQMPEINPPQVFITVNTRARRPRRSRTTSSSRSRTSSTRSTA